MKAFLFLSFSIAVAGSRAPQFTWDPASAKDCVEWVNAGEKDTCEYIRDYFTITPEQFTAWNPSLGLDCSGWNAYQSYCIVTQQRLDDSARTRATTSTSTSKSTTTSTSGTPGPSPGAWKELGCFQAFAISLMGSEAKDPALTVAKCQDICKGKDFAGVTNGNKCWCGSLFYGEKAQSPSDCNLPCSGYDRTICGGANDLVTLFGDAKKIEELEASRIASSSTTTSALPTTSASLTASASLTTSWSKSDGAQTQPTSPISSQSTSGATRNLRFF